MPYAVVLTSQLMSSRKDTIHPGRIAPFFPSPILKLAYYPLAFLKAFNKLLVLINLLTTLSPVTFIFINSIFLFFGSSIHSDNVY